MTTKVQLCDQCKYDGGFHFSEDGSRSWRCPNIQAAELQKHAAALTATANEKAFEDAKVIFRDFAAARVEFSANEIRELFDEADIPDPVNGAVFSWAAGAKASPDGPLIEATGRRVPSTENTTRHKITVWRSRIYRGRMSA